MYACGLLLLLENHDVVFGQRLHLMLGEELKARLENLAPEGGLVATNVLQGPLWRVEAGDHLAFVPMKVNEHDRPAVLERPAQMRFELAPAVSIIRQGRGNRGKDREARVRISFTHAASERMKERGCVK